MSSVPSPASLAPIVLPPEVWPRDLATHNHPTPNWLLSGYLLMLKEILQEWPLAGPPSEITLWR